VLQKEIDWWKPVNDFDALLIWRKFKKEHIPSLSTSPFSVPDPWMWIPLSSLSKGACRLFDDALIHIEQLSLQIVMHLRTLPRTTAPTLLATSSTSATSATCANKG
jgi:hypothetical protein